MVGTVNVSGIYWDNRVVFSFRKQALNTLKEFVERMNKKAGDIDAVLDMLNDLTCDMDIDEVEELFYNEKIETIATQLGIKL